MMKKGIAGLIAVLLWLGFFLPGLTIASQPYRDCLAAGDFSWVNFGMVFLCYTVTNAAILCIVAGVAGAMARQFFSPGMQEETDHTTPQPPENNKASDNIFSGALRGFLIYLVFLAGAYAATSSPFAATTAEQYARMAGTVSLLSFLISYEPNFIRAIIGLVSSKVRVAG